MKTEELKALGLTEEQVNGVMAIHGKDTTAHNTALSTAEQARDTYKSQAENLQTQLDTANATIESFGDVKPEDVANLREQVNTYKTEAANAKAKYDADITQRDQTAWLNTQLDTFGVKSPLARQAITANVMAEKTGLPWRDNAFLGFADYMKAEKEKDPTLYLTEEEKAAEEAAQNKAGGSPAFAGATGSDGTEGSGYTPPRVF
jgi:seryl-tRNA synthetase